ncbi:hypothetical protein PPSIR1_03148 [Plesiocystis pacifica SIR-1]|uniref:AMP-dependent synthetase/ligase domain-containing protein n=1 Tax=Plesiocystis pacifica SIR-1 TaxID=391625 RepID=A6GI24_9BACT|nr:hypothetical protein [Plesiocystis pacifica]EDM74487.1 hypothetical protein PPSIR1_03148 [Plesiocystis pacifica SIR-1]
MTAGSTFDLHPGDVLSYSAGSTQTGPEGFRKLRDRPGLFSAALARWPDIGAALAGKLPLAINAYPAAIGFMSAGVVVDSYLSPRVLSRALQLGAAEAMPTILIGQSLFLADALREHLDAGRPVPRTLLVTSGGYTTPRTLEASLRSWLADHVDTLLFLHGYGVAEVDAGCMMARERDASGRLIFHPRADVDARVDEHGQLLLSLRGPEGERLVEDWATGDSAEASGEGFALWNHRRMHPVVEAALESWTEADWRRRTGYVRREGERVWIQLRRGAAPDPHRPDAEDELDHWEFGRRHGFAWLDKPYWR